MNNRGDNFALWIFPNFLEAINELPNNQRADVWRAVCEFGLGQEIDIKKFKNAQKMCIKMLIPLLKLRNTGGSLRKGETRNPAGKNQFKSITHCKIKKCEDNPYPNPQDNNQDNPYPNPQDNLFITRSTTGNTTRNITRNTTETETNKSSLNSDLINGEQKEKREEFEEFWEKYPKQRAGSKEKGYKAYLKAIKEKKITHERLMKVIEVYAKSKEVQNGYACGCERWFNDEKYNNADFRPIEEDSYVFYGRTYYGEDARRAREIDEDKVTYNARC